jgi:hypothetical protein
MAEEFWHLADSGLERNLAEWDQTAVDLESVICPIDPGHQRPGKRITDLSVILPNSPLGDFVWTWQSECLVQSRPLEIFKERGFRGFKTTPVQARFKRPGVEPPKLWELSVTGWGGVAPTASGVHLIKSCPGCGLLQYSGFTNPEHLVDLDAWDGSDFFMVWPLPGFIFVTNRVAEAILNRGLTGLKLLPLSGLTSHDGLSPGRLSYWMPEPRARKLGEPLGIY